MPSYPDLRMTVWSLLVVVMVGCGGGPVRVTGLVTLDGTPVNTGTVTFYPVEDGTLYYGTITASGRYELASVDGRVAIEPGEYDVAVRIVEAVPSPDPNQPPQPKLRSPVKYGDQKTSGFRFRIRPGANTADLPMKSK
ncbi:MAG: hypothetical protein K1X57_10030 [Gemmataceae bacterium]|nr:hypothetical protein [Gemmataceae bacterium]